MNKDKESNVEMSEENATFQASFITVSVSAGMACMSGMPGREIKKKPSKWRR